jgi:ABC-2 type transport system ATP-binding protein
MIVSSHVMDEALRCDRLLLMRDGRIIADTTPTALLHDTGTNEPEAAFLALIERDRAAEGDTRRSRRQARQHGEAVPE